MDSWGELTRYDTGDGKEPFYIWDVRVEEGGEYKKLQIDNHKDLLNQLAMQQNCLRDLNWIPQMVKQDIWRGCVLKSLIGIEDRTIKVAASADTTEMAMLRESFMHFLTHNQIQKNGQPHLVKVGQVFHQDGAYYFDTKGLLNYLRMEKHILKGINLNKWLQDKQDCEQDAVLKYITSRGEEKFIRCWKKMETPELLELNVFYDDVYEGNEDIIQKNTLNKEEKEGMDGDDTKF